MAGAAPRRAAVSNPNGVARTPHHAVRGIFRLAQALPLSGPARAKQGRRVRGPIMAQNGGAVAQIGGQIKQAGNVRAMIWRTQNGMTCISPRRSAKWRFVKAAFHLNQPSTSCGSRPARWLRSGMAVSKRRRTNSSGYVGQSRRHLSQPGFAVFCVLEHQTRRLGVGQRTAHCRGATWCARSSALGAGSSRAGAQAQGQHPAATRRRPKRASVFKALSLRLHPVAMSVSGTLVAALSRRACIPPRLLSGHGRQSPRGCGCRSARQSASGTPGRSSRSSAARPRQRPSARRTAHRRATCTASLRRTAHRHVMLTVNGPWRR